MPRKKRLMTAGQRYWLVMLAAEKSIFYEHLRYKESARSLDRLVDLGFARWVSRGYWELTQEGRAMAESARLL